MHIQAARISLTVEDIKSAIHDWMISQGYKDIDKIYFSVEGVEDPTDFFAQFPLQHELTGATVVMKEEKDD